MSRGLAYLQLFRLPNVFTALSDVAMGYVFAAWHGFSALQLAVLGLASGCLYTAGMVLNDAYDAEIDARERPWRPIPSGRVQRRIAFLIGYQLLVVGCGLAYVAGSLSGTWLTGATSVVLAGAIIAYNAWLKSTPLATLAMGSCRAFNILMAMSTVGEWSNVGWVLALGMGVYIAGITWYSRSEATESKPLHLALATTVIVLGLITLGWTPVWDPSEAYFTRRFPYANQLGERWLIMWLLLGASIGYRCLWGVIEPSAARVQAAVKNTLLSLIVLDAVLVFAVGGIWPAGWVIALLIPSRLLGRWVYST